MRDRPQALYRFFATDGALLYIGISLNPGHRWKQHQADKPWWTEVATITVEHHDSRQSVAEAERMAIKAERPRYNMTHNTDTIEGAERLARSLARMAQPPARYWSACPDCAVRVLPDQIWIEGAGWLAVYDCCEQAWTQEVER
jgi:predicted GIY-YIG superfamily endonuclease